LIVDAESFDSLRRCSRLEDARLSGADGVRRISPELGPAGARNQCP
jgi:hypothetical protein